MEVAKNVMKVFWGMATIDGKPTWTWMCAPNSRAYELALLPSWQDQKRAIEVAKERLRIDGGGMVEVYSQGGQLLQEMDARSKK